MKAVAHRAASVSIFFPGLGESLAFERPTVVDIRRNIRTGASERVQSPSLGQDNFFQASQQKITSLPKPRIACSSGL